MTPDPGPDDAPRVYLDVMLGRLATLLRMAGWDAAYALDRGVEADDAILGQATTEDRLLLTRDRQLVDRALDALLLTSRDTEDQLAELREAGFLVAFDEPTRCAACNGQLLPVPGAESTPDHAPSPATTDVWRCEDCGQYFWRGSHWADVIDRYGPDTRRQ
jgi:hypothetical protein